MAKEIVDYILNTTFVTNDTKFYDLCCGSGAVTIELLNRGIPPNKIVMCDISSWGVFWKSVGEGTFDLNKFYTMTKNKLFNVVSRKDNKVIILRSWNEWGEGNYMEPDLKFGKKYIQVMRDVMDKYK